MCLLIRFGNILNVEILLGANDYNRSLLYGEIFPHDRSGSLHRYDENKDVFDNLFRACLKTPNGADFQMHTNAIE